MISESQSWAILNGMTIWKVLEPIQASELVMFPGNHARFLCVVVVSLFSQMKGITSDERLGSMTFPLRIRIQTRDKRDWLQQAGIKHTAHGVSISARRIHSRHNSAQGNKLLDHQTIGMRDLTDNICFSDICASEWDCPVPSRDTHRDCVHCRHHHSGVLLVSETA